jgi:RhtB (resistance to homoserine/threonine) family protein
MFGIHDYWLFLVSGLLLNMVPGQDTIYIVARSISQGRRAGLLSVLGISTGCLVHTLAASLGLSAVLAASSEAFLVIKFIGAAYLIYLGLQMFFNRVATARQLTTGQVACDWMIYRQGMVTNVLNPKVALFFLALLPQFIESGSSTKTMAFLILGLTFIVSGTIWCMLLVWFSLAFRELLRKSHSTESWLKRATGALFVGLGLKLALERSR